MRLIDTEPICGKCQARGTYSCCLCRIGTAPTVDAVVLPCKPGDHVFRLCGTKKSRYVGERIVSAVTLCGNGSWTILSSTHDTLGKTVFLTRAEAEAALAKRRNEHET